MGHKCKNCFGNFLIYFILFIFLKKFGYLDYLSNFVFQIK